MMSGTSLDGVDLAFVQLTEEGGKWRYDVMAAETVGYDAQWRHELQNAIHLSAVDLLVLNNKYGQWLGELAKGFIQRHNLEDVDFIASHGHTVQHQIDKALTYQLGSGYHLSLASGCRVINDFRSMDVALGGEGAPLVPIADEHLFSKYDFCLNLGGIANVSFQNEGRRLAFDIGLSNMLLNHLTQAHGLEYDKGGELARSGTRIDDYFEALNSLPYFQIKGPKSTGYEWFVDEVLPVAERFGHCSFEDTLSSVVHHVAFQIGESINAIRDHGTMLVTGGGARNDFMVELIRRHTADGIDVIVPDNQTVDFKEAIAFGLMGALKIRGEVNCFASVTGASRDSSGGVIYDVT